METRFLTLDFSARVGGVNFSTLDSVREARVKVGRVNVHSRRMQRRRPRGSSSSFVIFACRLQDDLVVVPMIEVDSGV